MLRFWILLVFAFIADAKSPDILFTDNEAVMFRNSSTEEINVLVDFAQGISDMNFHFERREIYVIIKSELPNLYRIVRFPAPGSSMKVPTYDGHKTSCYNNGTCVTDSGTSSVQVLLEYECPNARNLLVDWESDNLYWSCESMDSGTVMVADLNGANVETFWKSSHDKGKVLSMDVDPYEQRIFWLHQMQDNTYRQGPLPLDGSNQGNKGDFDPKYIKYPTKINVDFHLRTVYITGQHNLSEDTLLVRSDYDGSNIKRLASCNDPGWSLGPRVLKDFLFWVSIRKSDSCTGYSYMDEIPFTKEVIQWRIYDPSVQSPPTNRSLLQCSHGSDYSNRRCYCPVGMVLLPDLHNCTVGIQEEYKRASENYGLESSSIEHTTFNPDRKELDKPHTTFPLETNELRSNDLPSAVSSTVIDPYFNKVYLYIFLALVLVLFFS